MSVFDLMQRAIDDTVSVSLGHFLPELTICATIVALLLVRMLVPRWKTAAWYVMMAGMTVALVLLMPALTRSFDSTIEPVPIFTGLLVFDSFSIYLRGLLFLFALLFASFGQVSGVPDDEDATEFCVLVLGALLGMCLMVSANHMLTVFLGVEMASVPCYVLAGLLRQRRLSSEASLKYAVYGAGAAGVMLYGISLLVGMTGSAHLPTMAIRLAQLQLAGLSSDQAAVLVLGGLMVAVGLAFKLSAVPFHFWAPDVFEGAPAEVGAFLSIASKAAALGLLVRLVLGLSSVSHLPAAADAAAAGPAPMIAPLSRTVGEGPGVSEHRVAAVVDAASAVPGSGGTPTAADLSAELAPTRKFVVGLLTLLAAITCTFGNLAAYGQTNMKRLLAYSTIAHAGYLMMPVAAAVAAIGASPDDARYAVATMLLYISIYLFMNLGAFAFVAFVRNVAGSERIDDYAGMIRRSPAVTVCMAIILFSLVGLPPLAGFAAKFAIFAALVRTNMLALLVIGGLNTVLSLFFYLRVVRVMILAPEPTDRPAATIPFWSVPGLYCAVLTLPLLALFIWWDGLFRWAEAAARSLLL